MTTAPIYGRLPCDTDESFRWFCAYRDAIPPRQLGRIRVPGTTGKPLAQLLEWFNSHDWSNRAAAWDSHVDELRRREVDQIVGLEAREVAGRHLQLLAEAEQLVREQLNKHLQISADTGDAVPNTKVSELTKLAEMTIKMGRLVRGESTEKVDNGPDLSNLSLDDLRKLQELKKKAGTK